MSLWAVAGIAALALCILGVLGKISFARRSFDERSDATKLVFSANRRRRAAGGISRVIRED